ncbi:DUF4214 domain-containing protein [Bradyrhizobium prioriisuperbiae]|uniref:DUF4214 domain-containing protein n=1 Tax=Bradyrhizobium prioriisuperbiae TaxID=2854389 RepID=UPI003898F914
MYGTTEDLFGTTVHDVKSPGGAVYALYDAILDRTPDPLGFEGWVSAIEHGTSLHDVTAAFWLSGSPISYQRIGQRRFC